MDILIRIGLLLLGGLLNFVKKVDGRLATRLASAALIIALLLALSTWIFYFAGIKNAGTWKVIGLFMQWAGIAAQILSGYLIAYIALAIRSKSEPEYKYLRAILRLTLWAFAVAIGNTFIVATVGKSQNIPYMLGFFKQSGYAAWFLYFIMTAESLGALGILLHFKLKTGPLAAAGLMMIMLGAIYTHWHNEDPFSDSYAAVGQLINISLLLTLYYFEKQAARRPQNTSIYIV